MYKSAARFLKGHRGLAHVVIFGSTTQTTSWRFGSTIRWTKVYLYVGLQDVYESDDDDQD